MTDMALAEFRKARSVELRLAGLEYEDIAKEVGYSNRGTAWRAVNTALRERVDSSVEEYRQTELARLDALQSVHWDKALFGDIASATLVLKVMGQRSRLLGLELLATQAGEKSFNTVVIGGTTGEFIRGLKMVDGITDD
ncbi:MAG: hypothetical protein NTX29_09995 [Actinobacteria bacterium]|nr:hypothetical protein [Actinomycetota bacterium]